MFSQTVVVPQCLTMNSEAVNADMDEVATELKGCRDNRDEEDSAPVNVNGAVNGDHSEASSPEALEEKDTTEAMEKEMALPTTTMSDEDEKMDVGTEKSSEEDINDGAVVSVVTNALEETFTGEQPIETEHQFIPSMTAHRVSGHFDFVAEQQEEEEEDVPPPPSPNEPEFISSLAAHRVSAIIDDEDMLPPPPPPSEVESEVETVTEKVSEVDSIVADEMATNILQEKVAHLKDAINNNVQTSTKLGVDDISNEVTSKGLDMASIVKEMVSPQVVEKAIGATKEDAGELNMETIVAQLVSPDVAEKAVEFVQDVAIHEDVEEKQGEATNKMSEAVESAEKSLLEAIDTVEKAVQEQLPDVAPEQSVEKVIELVQQPLHDEASDVKSEIHSLQETMKEDFETDIMSAKETLQEIVDKIEDSVHDIEVLNIVSDCKPTGQSIEQVKKTVQESLASVSMAAEESVASVSIAAEESVETGLTNIVKDQVPTFPQETVEQAVEEAASKSLETETGQEQVSKLIPETSSVLEAVEQVVGQANEDTVASVTQSDDQLVHANVAGKAAAAQVDEIAKAIVDNVSDNLAVAVEVPQDKPLAQSDDIKVMTFEKVTSEVKESSAHNTITTVTNNIESKILDEIASFGDTAKNKLVIGVGDSASGDVDCSSSITATGDSTTIITITTATTTVSAQSTLLDSTVTKVTTSMDAEDNSIKTIPSVHPTVDKVVVSTSNEAKFVSCVDIQPSVDEQDGRVVFKNQEKQSESSQVKPEEDEAPKPPARTPRTNGNSAQKPEVSTQETVQVLQAEVSSGQPHESTTNNTTSHEQPTRPSNNSQSGIVSYLLGCFSCLRNPK